MFSAADARRLTSAISPGLGGGMNISDPLRSRSRLQAWQLDKTKKDVASVIFAFFEAGKNKDLSALGEFHAPRDFSKFDENPPYTRQDSDEAFVYEQAAFANISDYDYKVEELEVVIIVNFNIATVILSYTGIIMK